MNYLDFLKVNYQAYLKNSDILTIFFQGEAGQGKTALVKEFCKNENLELYILNLNCVDEVDLSGMPYIDNGVQKYSIPEFFNMKKGVLFLDEFNRLNNSSLKASLLSLLQDKAVNGHKLSNEVMIVTAGNTDSDDYEVNQFDKAFSDRIMTVAFKRPYSEFIKYLESKHDRSHLLDFYKLHSDSLKNFTYRRLEKALNFIELGGPVESLNYSLSPSVFTLYTEYLNKNLFTIKDVFEGKILDRELDSSAEKKILFDVKDALKNDYKFKANEAKNLNTFLNSVRAENKQLFFKDLQDLALNDKNFEAKKAQWKKLELFKGLKEFLDVYLK